MTAQAPGPEDSSPEYRGVIVIEWPPPYGSVPHSAINGSLIVITDALTGKAVTTCSHVTVHADAAELVTADLTMFADADGEPVLDGMPVLGAEEILTGTFPFFVAEMRVRQQ